MKIISIGGNGVVGRAFLNSLKRSRLLHCTIVDPTVCKDLNIKHETLLDTDFIFISVPTPTVNDKHDASRIKEYLDKFSEFGKEEVLFNPIIVINSTTIINFQDEYKDLKIVYNPEFIQDATANDDFINQKQVVIGGNIANCLRLKQFYIEHTYINSDAEYSLVTIEEAINYKYLRNLKQSMNLIFWEIAHDISYGDSKKIKHMLDKDPVGDSNIIGMDGYRGFGGKCLPKDLQTLIEATSLGNRNTNDQALNNLLIAIRDYNFSLTA